MYVLYIYLYINISATICFEFFSSFCYFFLLFFLHLCHLCLWWADKIRVEKHNRWIVICCHLLFVFIELTKLEEMTLFFIAITTFVTHLPKILISLETQTISNIVSNVHTISHFLLLLFPARFFFSHPFPSHFLELMVFHYYRFELVDWLTDRLKEI